MESKIIQERLLAMQDKEYASFMSKLIPDKDESEIIGVRIPDLTKYAKELLKTGDVFEFLHSLPHKFFEEYQLHVLIISAMKDFDTCIKEIDNILPYIDNWATCDCLSPNIFKKYHKELLPYIMTWIKSEKTYTKRFAIGMLMQHFLDEDFDAKFLEIVATIRSKEYYVNMMIAWYFATALAKRYDETIPYIENNRLDKWTHNKAIQKAIESYRVSDEQKAYLKKLRIKIK